MKRLALMVLLILIPVTVNAELLEMRQTIFGMD